MAISADLRRRAVEAYERGEGNQATIAERFAVGVASLGRWLKIKRDTGSVERAPRAGGNPRRVTPAGEAMLREWLADDVSVATARVGRAPRRCRPAGRVPADRRAHARTDGADAQKKSIRAVQRLRPDVVAEREAFAEWQQTVDGARIVCVDESGIVIGARVGYGYAPRGRALHHHRRWW